MVTSSVPTTFDLFWEAQNSKYACAEAILRMRIVKRGRKECEIKKFIARAASHSLRNDEYRATQRCTGKRLSHFLRQSMKVTPTQFLAISNYVIVGEALQRGYIVLGLRLKYRLGLPRSRGSFVPRLSLLRAIIITL